MFRDYLHYHIKVSANIRNYLNDECVKCFWTKNVLKEIYSSFDFLRILTHVNDTFLPTPSFIHKFYIFLYKFSQCSKAYIHSRMRAKTSDFLKVLNRARPEPRTVEKKTIT